MEKRLCTSCKTEKPESEFHRFGKDGARVGNWCQDCYSKNKKKAPKRPAPAGTPA